MNSVRSPRNDMQEATVLSHDGCVLQYGYSQRAPGKPWIALIIPFGLKLAVARPFFDALSIAYNVVTWEARLILAPPERQIKAGELSVANHVADLITVLDACRIDKANLVGYCSGAGVALAAIDAHPDRFGELVLVNGEYTMLKDSSCVTQFGSDIDNLLPMASKDRKMAQFIIDRMQFENKGGRAPPEGIHLPFSKAHYFHRYALNYLAYRAVDFEGLARRVKRKTLLIAGQCDLQTNLNSAIRIKQSIEQSEVLVEPEGDHYELLRPGSRTLAMVRKFLDTQLGSLGEQTWCAQS